MTQHTHEFVSAPDALGAPRARPSVGRPDLRVSAPRASAGQAGPSLAALVGDLLGRPFAELSCRGVAVEVLARLGRPELAEVLPEAGERADALARAAARGADFAGAHWMLARVSSGRLPPPSTLRRGDLILSTGEGGQPHLSVVVAEDRISPACLTSTRRQGVALLLARRVRDVVGVYRLEGA